MGGGTTTGAGNGIPKLIPTCTPALTVVIPRAARARIAMVFFIFILYCFDGSGRQSFVINRSLFCNPRADAAPGIEKLAPKPSLLQKSEVLVFRAHPQRKGIGV